MLHSRTSSERVVESPDMHHNRTILQALFHLLDGYHTVIVAHPASEAFDIVDSISHYAREMDIPHEISDDNHLTLDGDVPMIYARPLGWSAIDASRGVMSMVRVVIDGSAVHERTYTPSSRRVESLILADEVGSGLREKIRARLRASHTTDHNMSVDHTDHALAEEMT